MRKISKTPLSHEPELMASLSQSLISQKYSITHSLYPVLECLDFWTEVKLLHTTCLSIQSMQTTHYTMHKT